MLRLATSIAALAMLGMGTASAEMISGTFSCTPEQRVLLWQGSAPASQLTQNSRCGSETLACEGTLGDFVKLLDKKKCESAETEDGVTFVCTDKSKNLTKHIDDLCKQVITGEPVK
jgi:hypothetical protein